MSEWVETTLGEVMDLDVVAVPIDPARDYAIVGVLNRGRGLLFRGAMAGASTRYKMLNRVRPNQIVYSRLKAFEGAITVAPETLGEAYASQEFPTFTCRPALLPEYFRLVTTTRRLWDDLQNLSTGMGGRRERVKPSDFLTVKTVAPPVAVQCRIVDLMGAVDAQVEALTEEANRVRSLLRLRREALVADPAAPLVPAAEAFSILMGRQRSPSRATGPSMTPYLRSANVGAGALNLVDVKEMDFNEAERRRFTLVSGDVLVSEGSASENAVGMTATWNDEIVGPVCFQNTLLRFRAIEGRSLPTYVGHWCKWAYESGAFREVASGTNIKHIGSRRAETMPVALPELVRQEAIGDELDAIEATWSGCAAEIVNLRMFRATLLTALLNREVEIPEAYDLVLKEPAA